MIPDETDLTAALEAVDFWRSKVVTAANLEQRQAAEAAADDAYGRAIDLAWQAHNPGETIRQCCDRMWGPQ